jgi:hypothetical protein
MKTKLLSSAVAIAMLAIAGRVLADEPGSIGAYKAEIADHLTRVTKSGNEVKIRGYVRWNQNCDALENRQIYLVVPPENGVVCIRTSIVTVQRIYEGEHTYCVGQRMRGVDVIYVPRPGFTGIDVIRYTVKFNAVRLTVDADISVKSDQVTTETGEVPPISEPPQTQGPIPVCAPLVS